jgi:hypothetical protein
MKDYKDPINPETSRRDFLKKSSLGFGALALSSILPTGSAAAQNHIFQTLVEPLTLFLKPNE